MKLNEVVSEIDQIVHTLLPSVKEKLEARYGPPIGEGRHRLAYGSKHIIVKVPKNEYGITDIYHEANLFKKRIDPNLARCRVGHINGLPVLFMQKLEKARKGEKVPGWADFVDCEQVGKDTRGRWKAYDYGLT